MRGRGRRNRMSRRGIRGLKARVGRGCCISKVEARLDNGGIRAGRGRGGSHSVRDRDASGGKLQERDLPRALNLERESSEHLRWIHLEQVQHYTNLPRQVAFPANTEQG